MTEPARLYGKYQVRHTDRSSLSPGFVFVLRPDRDRAAYQALMAYADHTDNDVLRDDLYQWLEDHQWSESEAP